MSRSEPDELAALRARVAALEGEARERAGELERLRGAQERLSALEQQLAQSQERLEEAEQLARIGTWWWDVRSGQVEWSAQVYRIFGLDPARFTPQIDSILALSPWPEDNERDRELIQRAVDSRAGGSYEQRFLRADGSVGYYESTFRPLFEGDELVAMRGTVQDITARKLAELELARSEEGLRVTLDSIGDAVIATDVAGRVVRMNPVAERLTGWTLEEARGERLSEVFRIVHAHTRAVAANPVEKVLATGGVVALANHTLLINRAGAEVQIADSGAPIRSDEGETLGVVLVFRDVSEEYALQARIRHSEKMGALGRLAGGVAHDFNNMLGGIMGAGELLEDHVDESEEAQELLSVVLQSAERAASLTAKLLAFSRREPLDTRIVDVHAVLEAALAILRHTIGQSVRLETDLRAAETRVEGDPAQLQNAFLNLCINAGQAMPEGGQLQLSSTTRTLAEGEVVSSRFDLRPGRYLAVSVQDTGHGMPPEVLERVFEPFFTTKGPRVGTGIGMAAVYGTVTRARGAITVESQVGAGTRFTVLLPLCDRAAAPPPAPRAASAAGRGRVLVVDDEAIVRVTTEALLRRLGYEVLLAEDGAKALARFEEERGEVDLVLLDMVMPGMSGLKCLRGLQTIDPEVRVILCSGYAREEDVRAMREAGVVGEIAKPYRMASLGRLIGEALRAPR